MKVKAAVLHTVLRAYVCSLWKHLCKQYNVEVPIFLCTERSEALKVMKMVEDRDLGPKEKYDAVRKVINRPSAGDASTFNTFRYDKESDRYVETVVMVHAYHDKLLLGLFYGIFDLDELLHSWEVTLKHEIGHILVNKQLLQKPSAEVDAYFKKRDKELEAHTNKEYATGEECTLAYYQDIEDERLANEIVGIDVEEFLKIDKWCREAINRQTYDVSLENKIFNEMLVIAEHGSNKLQEAK